MTAQDDFLSRKREKRDELRHQIELMEAYMSGEGGSGSFGTTSGGEKTTQQSIDAAKAKLAEIEKFIADRESPGA